MKLRTGIFIVIAALMVGCAAPQPVKISTTKSGRPEATIRASVDQIKAALIAENINYGYTVESDTAYQLVMVRGVSGKENTGIAMSIGNINSSNSRTATYTFAPAGGSVRVVASMSWRAQLPGGQVNTADLNGNNNIYNTYQKQLDDIKAQLENPQK